MTTEKTLKQRQIASEKDSQDHGIARYYREIDSNQGESLPSLNLLRNSIEPMTKAIEAYMSALDAGKASKGQSISHYLKQFPTETIAYLTVATVLEHLRNKRTWTSTALSLANKLESQAGYDTLRKEDPQGYKKFQKILRSNKSRGDDYKTLALKRFGKTASIITIKWTAASKAKLGVVLLDLCCSHLGIAERVLVRENKKRSQYMIQPTAKTVAWMENSHAYCSVLTPQRLPTLTVPVKWDRDFQGGYITSASKTKLVKRQTKEYLKELQSVSMPVVYRSLNHIQQTGWRINPQVLALVRQIVKLSNPEHTLAGVAAQYDIPLSAPFSNMKAPENKTRFLAWKAARSQVYLENARLKSKRIQLAIQLTIADQFKDDVFYFPQNLDWRGRCYSTPTGVNQQSSDVGRSLLTFDVAKPLGKEGMQALRYYLAATHGETGKKSLEVRDVWVTENMDNILACATDPIDSASWWGECDNPIAMYAACVDFKAAMDSPVPEEYASSLPLSVDGVANGSQHLSAWARDKEAGKSCGLVPSEEPSDMYLKVAAAAEKLLKDPKCETAVKWQTDERYIGLYANLTTKWQGKILRDLTKRPSMCYNYGISLRTMKTHVLDSFFELKRKGLIEQNFPIDVNDTLFVTDIIHEAIGVTVESSKRIMTFLKQAARITSKQGLPIVWRSPSGFMIQQDYRRPEYHRVGFHVQGVRTRLHLRKFGTELNKQKQGTSLCANLVHGNDSAHLALVISKAAEKGITHVTVCHDSMGCHAADMSLLGEIIRTEFVKMHQGNFLEEFREGMVKSLVNTKSKEIIPDVPKRGNLDIEQIVNSKYFFV